MIFFIWLIIVIVIIAASLTKSMRQKDDSRKKKTAGQNYSSSAYRRRTESPREDILTRSKRNAAGKSAKNDTAASKTASSFSAVAKPTAADWGEIAPRPASSKAHEPETDFSGLMDKVQDLIVKGYEPKLSFERDFISEGVDFLNRHYYK